jgi:hypothetical protein
MANPLLEVPLVPSPQILQVQLGSRSYSLRLRFLDTGMGGWIMDINTVNGTPILCGIPLVTGCNLLEQFGYEHIDVILFVYTDGNFSAIPNYSNLGIDSHLVFRQT